MKVTIDLHKHPSGTSCYIDVDGKSTLQTLIEPRANPEDIARLISETLLPGIQKETTP